jgi:hypothetical protein
MFNIKSIFKFNLPSSYSTQAIAKKLQINTDFKLPCYHKNYLNYFVLEVHYHIDFQDPMVSGTCITSTLYIYHVDVIVLSVLLHNAVNCLDYTALVI